MCIYNYTHFVYNLSMVVNNLPSQIEHIRRILKEQNGILLTADLAKSNIPRVYLAELVRNGEIERVSRGVYRLTASIEDELFSFQARYRSSIYSHETALYLHDLTDRTPLRFSITVPVGYHSVSLNESGHKIFYVQQKLLGLGVISLITPHGNQIRGTDLERTICDMLRSRSQIDVQLVNQALKRYVVRSDKNLDRLYSYARQFRVQRIVRETIEVLL